MLLVIGTSPFNGRLEVQFHGAVWGTACSASFDVTAAAVVCPQLGCSGGGAVVPAAVFGAGPGPILLADVQCANNSLAALAACSIIPGGQGCDPSQDVGIRCLGGCAD